MNGVIKTSKQMLTGKAFEYAILREFKEKLAGNNG